MSLKPASEYTGDVFDLYEEGTEAEMRVSIKTDVMLSRVIELMIQHNEAR